MAFEDPSKLKIDLRVEPESSNRDLTEPKMSDETADKASTVSSQPQSSEPEEKSETSKSLHSEAMVSPATQLSEASLTPWKNRFAKGTQGKSTQRGWQQQIAAVGFSIVDRGAVWLSILTIISASVALGSVGYITDPRQHLISNLMVAVPICLGFFLYALFIVRLLLMVNSLRPEKRYVTFLRSVAPAIVANTMTSWGIMLALAAMVVAKLFGLIKSLESQIGHQHLAQAMAVLALVSAGFVQILLVLLLIVSMVIYQKLFQWIEKRTSELSEVDFGQKKAGLVGVVVGAIFGLCGMHICLAAGGEHPGQAFTISTLIWSMGILIASIFFSRMCKLRRR